MTYEYVCEACGHQWEAEQSIKDAPLKKCSACGKPRAKRLVSGGTGFLLKGGGWYADGYGSGSASASSSSDSSPAPKSGADAAKKTETPKTDAASDGGGSKSTSETPKAKSAKAS